MIEPLSIFMDEYDYWLEELPHFEGTTSSLKKKYDKDTAVYRDGEVIAFINIHGFHRTDGPAVLRPSRVCFLENSKFHRTDGPAVYEPHYNAYWQHGKRHRLDGPAYITTESRYSSHVEEWHINGEFANDVIYKWAKENKIDLKNLSDNDKVLLALQWSDYEGN